MELVWFVLGAVTATALVALRQMRHGRHAAREMAEARSAREVAEQRCRELERSAVSDAADSKIAVARLEAELEASVRIADEKLAAFSEVREEFLALIGKSAGEVLDQRGKQLVDQLRAQLATEKAEATADLSQRQQAVEQLVKPLADSMKQMHDTVAKIDVDRRRSHTELTETLRAVSESHKELRTETGALGRALRQPQTRGRWGEMHLRRLLEMAGLSAVSDFTEQTHIDDEGTFLRPDLVVHLPGNKDIVVDAKAPLAPYLDACEATDENTRAAHMKLFTRGMRAHVKKLASKDYASQFDNAPDFVLMYIPGEHFFAAAVEADPALIEDALRDCVLIATPTTLVVMLKTVAHSWQQEKVADEAQAIAALGQQLYDRLGVCLTHVDRVSKCLNTLVDAQNKTVGSLERMVLPTARRFPELGAVAADKELPAPRQVNQSARQVQVRELLSENGPVTPSSPVPSENAQEAA